MRFTPKEDIKSSYGLLEEGSPITAEKRGIPAEDVERYYSMGLVEIEGRDPAPPRKVTGGAVVQPQNSVVGHASQEG
jgi:hypothetical protein